MLTRRVSMKVITRFATPFQCSVVAALVLMSVSPTGAHALADHSHSEAAQTELTLAQKAKRNALIKIIRDSTDRFQDPEDAMYEGYALQFGCVSGDSEGAMGLHFVNMDLVGKGVIDPTKPQIVIYEPTPSGRLKLIGADFLVMADQWDTDPKH